MPKRPVSPSSNNSSTDRLEPKLLKAVEANDIVRIAAVVKDAHDNGQDHVKLLSIGLVRACDRKLCEVARFLLSKGANPDHVSNTRQPNLLRAAEYGVIDIAKALLDHDADLNVRNKKGRTALMTAAWKDQFEIVKLLHVRGANVNTVDLRRRNVLHNLAADTGDERNAGSNRGRCGMVTVDYLLQAGVNVEARDELGRTALHWTSVTDNEMLMRRLLQPRSLGATPKAELHVVDSRMKTPLHLAVSHRREKLVAILLERGADVNAKSDGGWTALHNACSAGGPTNLVEVLLNADANVNSELLNGRTPLHIAAESGNLDAVRCLVAHPSIKRGVKDRFGNTPLLMAAQHQHQEIAEMLAPWNHLGLLSQYEIEACKRFNAVIVDFGHFHNENKVVRRTVYDLLYARDDKDPTKHAISTLPKNVKSSEFRWIHLPANNIAWCDTLLTKRFIEEGSKDLEAYKALESSFSHQHRGLQHHARFMRPMCQLVHRTAAVDDTAEQSEIRTPKIVVNGVDQNANTTPAKDKTVKKTKSPASSQPSKPNARRPNTAPVRSALGNGAYNIYMFMPYLHFETSKRREKMQRALKHAEQLHLRNDMNEDEVLIRAHLTASSSFLHVRRTLDQFFYHNIDTHMRDNDQVVYRYQLKTTDKTQMEDEDHDPKIFMVDQLWMWILGKDLVVTSFPQRWQQPRNDPLNVLDGIIEDINSKSRDPVQNVYELAMTIAGRCFGTFDRHRKGDSEYQFLDMFEASIGDAMDNEAVLFQDFSKASRQASEWLQHHSRPNKFSRDLEAELKARKAAEVKAREAAMKESHVHTTEEEEEDEDPERRQEPRFVDKLLDVGSETDLLAEIKDIRDELDIIRMVLDHQIHLLPELRNAIHTAYEERSNMHLRKIDKVFDEQEKTIANPLKDINRMDKQAERIYTSIRDLLDLKQKHANAFEARFARDQAAGTVRQGQTIMVFTIVTVIFLPLSFIAAFFAINIEQFPHSNGMQQMSLSYVSGWTFGIGLAISVPCIVIALSVDELAYYFKKLRRRIWIMWLTRRWRRNDIEAELQLQNIRIEQTLSMAKSMRQSVEQSRNGRVISPLRKSMEYPKADMYNRRRPPRSEWDIERGR